MKAIDTLSRTEHWERMIEIGMLLKYRAVVADRMTNFMPLENQ